MNTNLKNFIVFWGLLAIAAVPSPAEPSGVQMQGGGRDSLLVMFWNVENFFDWKDGGESPSDAEFSAGGARRWTAGRFFRKARTIGKAVLYIASEQGMLPDVIGFAEVENRGVMVNLLKAGPLETLDYGIVHYDSPDPRGIDCALLYRRGRLELLGGEAVSVLTESGDTLPTRSILLACFRVRETGDSVAVSVNHHPSKYGGAASEPRREAAVRSLLGVARRMEGWRQVAIGDFNDTPDSGLYLPLEEVYLNLAAPLARKGVGSLRFDGRWELIDQAFVSREMAEGAWMEVVRLPFLMVRDGVHAGEKPLRTYSGPKYLGGVSDHCPVLVHVVL